MRLLLRDDLPTMCGFNTRIKKGLQLILGFSYKQKELVQQKS